MDQESPKAEFETLQRIVQMYENSGIPEDPEEELLALADLIRILRTHNMGSMNHALHDVQPQIHEIFSAIRPLIGAKIGQLIGSISRRITREQQEKIAQNKERIEMLMSIDAGTSTPEATYEALLQTGWKTHLRKEEWSANEFERRMTRQAEEFIVRKLEHEMEQIQQLFRRFVTEEGVL